MICINRPFPSSAGFALGLALGIALVLFPLSNSYTAQLNAQHEIQGQALTNAVAREAVDAAFRQDLISLSAILEAAANHPNVQKASIHNVEGRILVQAGKHSPSAESTVESFQATISLQDSVAGLVTLSLEKPSSSSSLHYPLYLALFALAFVYVFWSLAQAGCFVFKKGRSDEVEDKPVDTKQPSTVDSEPSISSENNLEEANSPESSAVGAEQKSAYASLCVKNIGALQQQLNGETFRKTFRELELKINRICQLYGALECQWHHDRYHVKLSAAGESEAIFNAACAAKLMLDLAGITNKVPLDLSAQISLEQDNTLVDPMPFVGLAVHHSNLAFTLLEERVELLDINDQSSDRRLIASFAQPYAELLKKQIHHLSESL